MTTNLKGAQSPKKIRSRSKIKSKTSFGALWRITVETTAEAEEAVSDLLQRVVGEATASYTDVDTGKVTVSAFLRRRPGAEMKGRLSDAGRVRISKVRKEDWAESWKRHFKAFTVGGRLLVKPSWSRRKAAKGQSVVVIDPGLSFGTGQHATTRFCLERIVERKREGQEPGCPSRHTEGEEPVCPSPRPSPRGRGSAGVRSRQHREKPQSFLDVGTGSGILAIAAAKLGYGPVHGFDFDPVAVRVAKRNAAKNRARCVFRRGDVTGRKPFGGVYDVVCANLTADLLEKEAGKLSGWVKRNGMLVLAGILRKEADLVRRLFAKMGFVVMAGKAEEEWESMGLRNCGNHGKVRRRPLNSGSSR